MMGYMTPPAEIIQIGFAFAFAFLFFAWAIPTSYRKKHKKYMKFWFLASVLGMAGWWYLFLTL